MTGVSGVLTVPFLPCPPPSSVADQTQSFSYDKASQECQLCPAGTFRDYTDTSTAECKLW